MVALCGCVQDGPCPGAVLAASPTTAPAPVAGGTFVSTTDSYSRGVLSTRTIQLAKCEHDAPAALLIHAPQAAGVYPAVVFQHGFQSRNDHYDQILQQLASHGFVVVAPQMYEPGLGAFTGNPSAEQEAETSLALIRWLDESLSRITGVTADTGRLGIAGHSRGGKVSWLALRSAPLRFAAIAGVDPVDGTGGPPGRAGPQARVTAEPLVYSAPSLIIGCGRSGRCAPDGDNHVQFYAASPAPAWHVVAPDYGHGDMLDEDVAQLAGLICRTNPAREPMRRLTAGLLVAFFRASLQGDTASYAVLTDPLGAPAAIDVENK
jgi:chlorophyllase